MIKTGLLVKLEAKPGKEQEVADFLKSALPLVEAEPDTVNWYAFRLNESVFYIFDTFPNDAGRDAHLGGKVAEALMAQAPDLFSVAPNIEFAEILASK